MKLYHMYLLNHEREELQNPSHTASLATLSIFVGAGRRTHSPAALRNGSRLTQDRR